MSSDQNTDLSQDTPLEKKLVTNKVASPPLSAQEERNLHTPSPHGEMLPPPPDKQAQKKHHSLWQRIFRNAGIVAFCSALTIAGMFARTFFLAHGLDLKTFGKVILCINFWAVARLLIKPGLSYTLQNFIPRYEEEGNVEAQASLCWLSAYIALAVGVFMLFLSFFSIPWIVQKWYEGDTSLIFPLQFLSLSAAFFLFGDIATMLLRLANHFFLALAPSAIASILVPLYFLCIGTEQITLNNAIVAIALAELFTLICLLLFLAVKTPSFWKISRSILLLTPLHSHWKTLRSTLTHTSFFGILQGSSEQIAAFLIGIFSGPRDIALIGMALQLSKPISMLCPIIGAAVHPELAIFHAQKKWKSILSLLNKTLVLGGGGLLAMLLGAGLLGPYLIVHILGMPDYVVALPIFYLLASSYMLIVMFTGFLPIAIAEQKVTRYNMAVMMRLIYLGIAIAIGINAWNAAMVQLLGSLTIRIFNDLPLYFSLQRKAKLSPY